MAAAAFAACSPQAPAQNAAPDQTATPASASYAPANSQSPQTGLKRVPLTIRSAQGAHSFSVQVAATPEQQERGLMYVSSLGDSEGMIFTYDPPQQVAFWMKNTLIPLDMIFIRPDRTIARITTAQPLDLTPVPGGEERMAAVLEIRGGRAAELGIRVGDRVEWQH